MCCILSPLADFYALQVRIKITSLHSAGCHDYSSPTENALDHIHMRLVPSSHFWRLFFDSVFCARPQERVV
jgi:hypothetical protein